MHSQKLGGGGGARGAVLPISGAILSLEAPRFMPNPNESLSGVSGSNADEERWC